MKTFNEECLFIILMVFVMSFANEAIKVFQKYLNQRLQIKWQSNGTLAASSNEQFQVDEAGDLTNSSETCPLVRSLHIPVNCNEIKKRKFEINFFLFFLLFLFSSYDTK
jgi:hypothetical protein